MFSKRQITPFKLYLQLSAQLQLQFMRISIIRNYKVLNKNTLSLSQCNLAAKINWKLSIAFLQFLDSFIEILHISLKWSRNSAKKLYTFIQN